VLTYGNEGTKYYEVKAPCILYFLPSWGCVFSNHMQYFFLGGGHLSASVTYLIAISEASTAVRTSTTVMQHSHADLNICTNPLFRSPAQAYILQLICLLLLYFNSQFPNIYTFQTSYSLSLCHSFLCLGSPCHPIANAKPTGFNTVPAALSKSCSEYQNIMTQLAYEHVNDSFFIHHYTKTEIISSMQSLTNQYPYNELVKRSHSGAVPHSSLVIFVFSNQFFPLDFCLAASNALP